MGRPRAIARLRGALLVLLLALVGGLVGLYLFGRSGRPEPRRGAGGEAEGSRVAERDLAVMAEGFDYTLEEEGKTLFRISGASYQMDREENVYLEDMAVTLYSAEGQPFELAGKEAIYNQDTQHTELKGDVTLRGPEDLTMRTERLELRRKGAVALNNDPVHFTYGEVAEGGADRLRADIAESIFFLFGNVWAQSRPGVEPPFGLRSRGMFFERRKHHARADDGVWLSYGPHYLEAERVNIWLTEDNRLPQFVRALWDVSGFVGAPPGGGPYGPATYQADKLSVVFEPESSDLHKMELEGTPRRQAVLRASGLGGGARRLEASYVVGTFEDGLLAGAEAFGGVILLEGPGELVPEIPRARGLGGGAPEGTPAEGEGEPEPGVETDPGEARGEGEAGAAGPRPGLRRITADRAKATFSPGIGMVSATLHERVDFHDGEQTARGDEARFDFQESSVELFGNPAELEGRQGHMVAPHVFYTGASGLMHADGGTRTRLTEAGAGGALSGSPLSRGEGPIWVESAEAFLRDEPRAFLFRGDVRAWRGENLLLADQMEGHEPEGTLEARGNVRTLWYGEEDGEAGGGEAAGPGRIEVTAESMLYERPSSRLVYRGGVESLQGSRTVSCEEMTIELGEDQRAEVLLFSGAVRMEDRETGRVMEGGHARYEVGPRTAVVTGEPVVMRDQGGTEVRGTRLLYDFNTGTAQMQGATGEEEPQGEDEAPEASPGETSAGAPPP